MEMIMPNKTIYVSDGDLPLFERAQELAGDNLSSAIVQALRRFIEIEQARQEGLEEITVLIGAAGNLRRKRFLGTLLVKWLTKSARGKGTDILNVYRTAKGRLALQTRTIKDWEYSWGDPDYEANPKNLGLWGKMFKSWNDEYWETFKESGNYYFEVFESVAELRDHVPNDVYQAVVQVMEAPPLEELDI